MSNCTQTLLVASINNKQQILDKIQEMFLQSSPYVMDNWGLYPTHSDYIEPNKEKISIGYIETPTEFMVRASHPNCPPHWYVAFAKFIGAQLLFQDLDGYGEKTTWDMADNSTNMSNFKYTVKIMTWYDKYTPFTREFLALHVLNAKE